RGHDTVRRRRSPGRPIGEPRAPSLGGARGSSHRLRAGLGVCTGAHHLQSAGRRTELPRLRVAHGAQRCLLQMLQLRGEQRLVVGGNDTRDATPCGEDGETGFWWWYGRPPRGWWGPRVRGGAPSGAPRGGWLGGD